MEGLIPGNAAYNGPQISQRQLLRPFPQFGDITQDRTTIGRAWYNALQLRIEKRYSSGLHFLASYTYSKTLEAVDYLNAQDGQGNMARVVTAQDTPHKLVLSGGYELPFFKNGPTVAKYVLGGWQMNTIVTFQSGLPISTPGSAVSTGVNPALDNPTSARWFNTCTINRQGERQNCLSDSEPAAFIVQAPFTLRTLSTRFSDIRSRRAPQVDFSLFKSIPDSGAPAFAISRRSIQPDEHAVVRNAEREHQRGAVRNGDAVAGQRPTERSARDETCILTIERSSMTRRELIQYSIAASAIARRSKGANNVDRRAVVKRHCPIVTEFDAGSSNSVGNGSFAFTVDATGLQTLPESFTSGVPLATQAEWAWHTQPNPEGFRYEDTFEEYTTRTGRKVRYPSRFQTPCGLWYRENPYRRGLARVAFVVERKQIENVRQELDLWDGAIRSGFRWKNQRVEVVTVCHPERDAIAVRISSPAPRVEFSFPYTSPGYPWPDWNYGGVKRVSEKPANERWSVDVVSQERGRLIVKHSADADHYFARICYSPEASLTKSGEETFVLTGAREFTIEFTPEAPSGAPLGVAETISASGQHWNRFWSSGGCIDLSGSTDARAGEMERRAVLSQYLTAIQCSGRIPPQETGLSGNSWYGKFHGEMHWWHAAHFPLWGRAAMLERSMPWYQQTIAHAKSYAAAQGYRGARWPKMCGPEGRVSPHTIGPLLIWEQPHLIYFAELFYREHPTHETLDRYSEIVHETAEFMASFAELDDGRYFLGPPVIPAQESYTSRETFNPTYELSYWAWGLKVAQQWRQAAETRAEC